MFRWRAPIMPPGKRADFWAQLITFIEVSGLAVAVETIVTTLPGRTRGRQAHSNGSRPRRHLITFFHLPTVNGREALWDAAPNQPIVVGLDVDSRSFLTTRPLDAEPNAKEEFPAPSI